MKNNKGITLIITIITVIVLFIMVGLAAYEGINSYEESKVIKFEAYMNVLQKKVDILVEERTDISTLGTELTSEQQLTLQNIIDTDENVETVDVTEEKIRYFSIENIEEVFDIEGVDEDIIVNFANREVISTKGVEKDGTMHYVASGLD